MVDRKEFYTKLDAKLSKSKIEGFEVIFDAWDDSGFSDPRWLAYILATAWHETGHTMQPIEEWGKGKSRPYGKKIKMNGTHYVSPDKIYYGRGFVQLTWYENYEQMGRILGHDLLNKPELALDKKIAAQIILEGMTKSYSNVGDFTGKSLEDYFNSTKTDWVGARKIINGTDKNTLIASYGKLYFDCLK